MELGPIFRSLIHNKSRFWLIAMEIALTLAIVVNCVNIILDMRAQITRPSGMDEEAILVIRTQPIIPDYKDDDYLDNSRQEDLRMLRAQPGVIAATAISQIPLSGSGSSAGRKATGSEMDTIQTPYFAVASEAVKTLGVEIIAGRDFVESDWVHGEEEEAQESGQEETGGQQLPNVNVLLTKVLADRLYPDGDALGKTITDNAGRHHETVVGIIGQMLNSWPDTSIHDRVMLYPAEPGSARNVRYMVRAEPAMVDTLYTEMDEKLLALNEGRIVEVKTLKEIKEGTHDVNTGMIQIFLGVSLLLIAVTTLGIVGLTSFSVTQRTRQIGTRRALGATRTAIVRYFLVETWIITGFGLAFGLILSYGLNFMLAGVADASRLDWPLLAAGMLLFWGMGLVAALLPALRGTTVSPVIATQTV